MFTRKDCDSANFSKVLTKRAKTVLILLLLAAVDGEISVANAIFDYSVFLKNKEHYEICVYKV